ncbi:hypothetical protein FRC09_009272 [Ceratobasidium sp. 395]|nr:hypothetical protein FRC09_009272 [Ceratobasidium sp. 395]
MDRPTSRWAAPATGGGFYDIYRGTLRNGEMVAIKCLRVFGTEEATKSLKHIARELNTWSTLQHPNVLGIHGLGVFQNRAAMISPWMENGNLMEYIHQKPEVDRFEMCKHISSGVAYLHSLEMVHGDLKSHNVLVSGDGVAKLIGFEVGSLRKSFLSSEDATTYWSGSVRWMAPELINEGDGRKKSMPTDVYALAMTILEVFTSKLPFDEHKLDPWVTLAVMEGKHPARPPELPMDTGFGDELWSLMVECWKSRPQHRPTADVITQERCSSEPCKSDRQPVTKRKRLKPTQQDLNETLGYKKQASLYEEQGKWELATELRLRILHLHQRWLGDGHKETISSKYMLAAIYSKQYRLQEAKELVLEVISARRRELGEGHPQTAQAMEMLAVISYREGQTRRLRGFYNRSAGSDFASAHSDDMKATSKPGFPSVDRSELGIKTRTLVSSGPAGTDSISLVAITVVISPTSWTHWGSLLHQSPVVIITTYGKGDLLVGVVWWQSNAPDCI